jgi:arylsulfatase A-like enzyme
MVPLTAGLMAGLVLLAAIGDASAQTTPRRDSPAAPAVPAGQEATPAPTYPNIVLIVIDTVRADHVGCYGYERNTTPNIDAVARHALVFKNAISAASWTTPSVAALLSSQYPSTMGIHDKPAKLNTEYSLLAEVLKKHGYRTHGIVSFSYLSNRLGFGRGFDEYDERSHRGHGGVVSPLVTTKAVKFLKSLPTQPFFLFVHNFDPHYSYILHDQYNYVPKYEGKVKSGQIIDTLREMRPSMSPEDIRYMVNLFDSELAYTDMFVDKILQELKRQKLYDDAIIVITADHGEEFMDRGWIGHTATLYQELIHVPLLIKLPTNRPGVVDAQVALIDVMPTLLSHLGLEVPENLEGRALDLAAPGNITEVPIFSRAHKRMKRMHFDQRPGPDKIFAKRSVIAGGRKLIYDETTGQKELYDLKADPGEQVNRYEEDKTAARRLEALLNGWRSRTQQKGGPQAPEQDESELFDPEQIKQLKSLGYM